MKHEPMHQLGRELAKTIGAHHRMEFYRNGSSEHWHEAQRASDEAVRLVTYLIKNLANRHHAVLLANAAGVPGYINQR